MLEHWEPSGGWLLSGPQDAVTVLDREEGGGGGLSRDPSNAFHENFLFRQSKMSLKNLQFLPFWEIDEFLYDK